MANKELVCATLEYYVLENYAIIHGLNQQIINFLEINIGKLNEASRRKNVFSASKCEIFNEPLTKILEHLLNIGFKNFGNHYDFQNQKHLFILVNL